MEDDDDAQESTEHPRSSGAKEPTGEEEDGDCAPEMTSSTTSVTATRSNQRTEFYTGTVVDEIDFNDNDAVFEKLWERIAVPATWSYDNDSFYYRDGPPSWEEVQIIWDAIDDKSKKKELAERKRHDDNCEFPYEDESTEHVLLQAACLRQPPVQIVQDLIEASESTIFEKGADDMMPLHFACLCKASVEVVRALLEAHESKATLVAKDEYRQTPLHLACRYEASVEVVRALLQADKSKETLRAKNKYRQTPLHLACRFEASVEVLRALADESKETLMAKEEYGWTPLHIVCARKLSVVVRALLEADESKATLIEKDDNGCTPLLLACARKASVEVVLSLLEADESKDGTMATAQSCQGISPIDCFPEMHAKPKQGESKEAWEQAVSLLAHYTPYTKDIYFKWLKKAFEADRERLFDNHFIWQLNQAMRNPFYTFFLMLDLLSNILLAVMFTIISSSYASSLASSSGYFVVIYILLCILTVREAIQLGSEGSVVWLADIWNLFDISNIILVSVSTLFMHTGKSYSDASYSLLMATGFLTWIHALSSLRSSFLEFAVFISGITNVIIKLVPFIVTTLFILCGFAYLYHMNNASRAGPNSCLDSEDDTSTFETYGDALFTTSAMMLNGIEDCMLAYNQEDVAVKWLSFLFALLMVVLLLNVIIAIVSTSWEAVTAKGRNVFLGNRIAFLSEFKFKAFDCIINRMKYEHDVDKVENILRHDYEVMIRLRDIHPDTTFDSYLRSYFWGDGIVIFLWKNPVSWEALKRPSLLAFLRCQTARDGMIKLRKRVKLEALGLFLATYVFAPLQFLCGLVTFGYFWPPAFRQFLFQIKEVDGDPPTLQKLNAELKDELLNEIKKELAQSVREVVSSIDGARDAQKLNTELKDEIVVK